MFEWWHRQYEIMVRRSTVWSLSNYTGTKMTPIWSHQVSRQSRDPPKGRLPGPSWENQSRRERGGTHDRQQAVHQCAAPGEPYHSHHLQLFGITAVTSMETSYPRPTTTSLMSRRQLQGWGEHHFLCFLRIHVTVTHVWEPAHLRTERN